MSLQLIPIAFFVAITLTMTMANSLKVDDSRWNKIYSYDLTISAQCDQIRKGDVMKGCVNNAMINMNQLMSSIGEEYKNSVNKDEARQRYYSAICCTVRDVKSCVLTITKDKCSSEEQSKVIDLVEQTIDFNDDIYQNSEVKEVRIDCHLFNNTCWVNIDNNHLIKPSQAPIPSIADETVKHTVVDVRISQNCRNALSTRIVPLCSATIKSSSYYNNNMLKGQCCVVWEAVDCLIDTAGGDCTDNDADFLVANAKTTLSFARIDCKDNDYHSDSCGGKHAGEHDRDGNNSSAMSIKTSNQILLFLIGLIAFLKC